MSSSKQNPKKKKKTKKAKGDKDPQWCTCNKPANEDMIACDNPGCSIEWFHMECVGLDPYNVPDGDWFCQRCTDTARRKSLGSESQPKAKSTAPKRPNTDSVPLQPAQKISPKKSSKPIFICEWCDSQFSSKQVCIEHKQQCRKNAKLLSKPSIAAESPSRNPHSSRLSPSPKRSRSRSPNSTQEHGASPGSPPLRRLSSASASSTASARNAHPGTATTAAKLTNPLAQFSSAQILACLEERHAAFSCECGVVFEDQTLYFLHRGSHNSSNPRKCSFCGYEAPNWYDFTTHFFQHKKSSSQA